MFSCSIEVAPGSGLFLGFGSRGRWVDTRSIAVEEWNYGIAETCAMTVTLCNLEATTPLAW